MDSSDTGAFLARALEQATEKYDARVFPGASFGVVVKRLAEEEGIEPYQDQSFKEFLLGYPETVWVIPRRRQDILVAHPDSTGEVAREVGPARIRKDLYDAFTDLSGDTHYVYDSKTDEMYSDSSPVAVQSSSPTLYPVPRNTLAQEIALRTAFLESVNLSEEVLAAVRSSLSQPKPLSGFAAATRRRNLAKTWYNYKFARLLGRINEWAAPLHIPWQAGWISSEAKTHGHTPTSAARSLSAVERALGSLDEADLARIMVPLDVVAKLLADREDAR